MGGWRSNELIHCIHTRALQACPKNKRHNETLTKRGACNNKEEQCPEWGEFGHLYAGDKVVVGVEETRSDWTGSLIDIYMVQQAVIGLAGFNTYPTNELALNGTG